jgi:hypothetical protein
MKAWLRDKENLNGEVWLKAYPQTYMPLLLLFMWSIGCPLLLFNTCFLSSNYTTENPTIKNSESLSAFVILFSDLMVYINWSIVPNHVPSSTSANCSTESSYATFKLILNCFILSFCSCRFCHTYLSCITTVSYATNLFYITTRFPTKSELLASHYISCIPTWHTSFSLRSPSSTPTSFHGH